MSQSFKIFKKPALVASALTALTLMSGCAELTALTGSDAGLDKLLASAPASQQAMPTLAQAPEQSTAVASQSAEILTAQNGAFPVQPATFQQQTQPAFGQASFGQQGVAAQQASFTPPAPSPDAPPNPRPGECYQKVLVPAQTSITQERVVVRPAGQQVRVVPAKYGTVTEQVVVKQATEQFVTVPARYRTVRETVVVRPAAQKVLPIPPQYDTVTKRVMVKPAQTVWKRGTGAITKVDSTTGEILCLVEEPAVYKTVTERVLVKAAGTRLETVPAVTQTIEKQVVAEPARVERRIIPAVTKPVSKRVIIEPAREVIVPVPAEYQTVDKSVVTAPSRTAWISIVCETNITPGLITRVQQALNANGFSVGRVDGVVGRRTLDAIERFQKANGLGAYGLTIETIRALGIQG